MSATKKFRKKIVAIGGGDIGCFGKKAYKVYWKGNRFFEEILPKRSKFQPLNGLFSKQ